MNTLAALGWQELALVLLVVMLFFGARKLPELARSLGSSVTEFKKGLRPEDAPKPVDPPKTNDTTQNR